MHSPEKILLYFPPLTQGLSVWGQGFINKLNLIINQIAPGAYQLFCNYNSPEVTQTDITRAENEPFFMAVVMIDVDAASSKNDEVIKIFDYLTENNPGSVFVVRYNTTGPVDIPEWLSDYPVYDFFELNYRTLEILNFNDGEPGESSDGFWTKLTDLAYDIKFHQPGDNPDKSKTIYLAEVSVDQTRNRDNLRRELLLSGYQVLPFKPLPRQLKEFENEVKSLMFKSSLSVHILGEQYGETPLASDYSYQELQNRIFNDLARQNDSFPDSKIQRIIWLKSDLETSYDKQLQYIKRLKRDLALLPDTEFVQSTLTELKEIIDRKFYLEKREEFELLEDEQHGLFFYIVADRYDPLNMKVIDQTLNARGIKYRILNIQKTDLRDVKSFMKILKYQRYILIIHRTLKPTWVKSIVSLIVRSKGYVDAVPASGIGIFTAFTSNPVDEYLPLPVKVFQDHLQSFEEQLNSFITEYTL